MTYQNTQSVLTENLGENKSPLTFGNFQTQICGAMSMGLLQSQSEIAKTGAKMAVEFTKEQKSSYVGQSEFLQGAYNSSLTAAHKQAEQMRIGAGGEFANAGFGMIGTAKMVHEGSGSETAQKLDNCKVKLAQQKHLLDLAHKNPPSLTSGAVGGRSQPVAAPQTYREEVVQKRAAQLSTEGASSSRELKNASDRDYLDWKNGAGSRVAQPNTETEAEMFKQKSYDKEKGQYYNDKATDEEVSRGTATRGAHHLEGLDEEAIKGMTTDQHAKCIAALNKSIESTKVEINTESNNLRNITQQLGEYLQIAKSCVNGGVQMWQSFPMAASKESEAAATLSNNSGGIAGGIAQNANSAKEGALSTAQNAMQSFGRVYDNMRG